MLVFTEESSKSSGAHPLARLVAGFASGNAEEQPELGRTSDGNARSRLQLTPQGQSTEALPFPEGRRTEENLRAAGGAGRPLSREQSYLEVSEPFRNLFLLGAGIRRTFSESRLAEQSSCSIKLETQKKTRSLWKQSAPLLGAPLHLIPGNKSNGLLLESEGLNASCRAY